MRDPAYSAPNVRGRTLLIGIGNGDRADDGLGPFVIRTLMHRLPASVTCVAHAGDGASLLESWNAEDDVVLIDCVRSGEAPGTVHHLDALHDRIPSEFFHYSSHAFGLAEAVEMARVLGRLPRTLHICGIEGCDFRWGSGLSPEVARAANDLIVELLQKYGSNAPELCAQEGSYHA